MASFAKIDFLSFAINVRVRLCATSARRVIDESTISRRFAYQHTHTPFEIMAIFDAMHIARVSECSLSYACERAATFKTHDSHRKCALFLAYVLVVGFSASLALSANKDRISIC